MGAVSTKLDDLEKARTFARFALSCVTIILFAAAFFALQKLTFTLRFPPFERTTIWTPGALLFTALLLAPPRRWWLYYVGLCIGAVAAYAGDAAIPPLTAFIAAQFLFVAVAIGAVGIRRFSPDRRFGTQAALLSDAGLPVARAALVVDIPVMVAVAIVCLPIFFTRLISRHEGAMFIALYLAYSTYLVLDARHHHLEDEFTKVVIYGVLPATLLVLVIAIRDGLQKRRVP